MRRYAVAMVAKNQPTLLLQQVALPAGLGCPAETWRWGRRSADAAIFPYRDQATFWAAEFIEDRRRAGFAPEVDDDIRIVRICR